MHYVYRIKSKVNGAFCYTGCTGNLKQRIVQHQRGEVPSTKARKPYQLVYYAAFHDKAKAFAFEQYLKTGSGKAFAKKRLW